MCKKTGIVLFFFVQMFCSKIFAQCSICTKTASQLGEGPAQGLNAAIVYLMLTPLVIMFFIGYKWWKREKQMK
jgi:amino acid transporter